jgi:hypothetical protein
VGRGPEERPASPSAQARARLDPFAAFIATSTVGQTTIHGENMSERVMPAVIDYFVTSVRRILGPFLRDAGFDKLVESDTRLTFSRGDVVVSIAYLVEDCRTLGSQVT